MAQEGTNKLKAGDNVGYKLDNTRIIGRGSNSIVYPASLDGIDSYVMKVLTSTDPTYGKKFDGNTDRLMLLSGEGTHFILLPERKGEKEIGGEQKKYCIMRRMGMDCALYIDKINRTDKPVAEDDLPFGNPNAFMDHETIATAYTIMLNVLKALNYLHGKDIHKIDIHPYNILMSGKFDRNGFLLEPDTLEVRLSDIWPEKEDKIMSGKTTSGNIEIREELKTNPERNPVRKVVMEKYFVKTVDELYRFINCQKGQYKIMPNKSDIIKVYSEATDVYSLGRIAIELLTGLLPSDQETSITPNNLHAINSKLQSNVAEVICSMLRSVREQSDSKTLPETLFKRLKDAIETSPHYKVKENEHHYYYVEMPYHRVVAMFGDETTVKKIIASENKTNPIDDLVNKIEEEKAISPSEQHKGRIRASFQRYMGTLVQRLDSEIKREEGSRANLDGKYAGRSKQLGDQLSALAREEEQIRKNLKTVTDKKGETESSITKLNDDKKSEGETIGRRITYFGGVKKTAEKLVSGK